MQSERLHASVADRTAPETEYAEPQPHDRLQPEKPGSIARLNVDDWALRHCFTS